MSNEKPKIIECPCCQSKAIMLGDEIACEQCDATYKITKTGATVKKIGVFKDHEARLKKCEDALFGDKEEPGPEVPDDDVEESEDEEDIIPG